MAQSAVEVKSFGVIQKAELKSQIIIATFQVKVYTVHPCTNYKVETRSATLQTFHTRVHIFPLSSFHLCELIQFHEN